MPNFQTARSPTGATKLVKHIKPKHVQNTARYPPNNDALSCSVPPLTFFGYADDIKDMIANPPVKPNCDAVLKTAPASACVFTGNTSITTRCAIVKVTVDYI